MRRGNHAFRLVTLQGDVMHSGGSMTGGSVSSRNVNLFSRERELKELTEKMSAGQQELERLLAAMRDGQAEKDRLKQESADALEALHQQEIAVARETERVSNAEEDAGSHSMRQRETEAAREQLMESILQIREQLSIVSGDTEKEDETRDRMEEAIPQLQRELAEARQETEAREAETLRLTLEVSDLRHEIETMTRDRNRYEQDRARMEREKEHRERTLAKMAAAEERDLEEAAEREAALEEARRDQGEREKITQSLEADRVKRQGQLKEVLAEMEGLHQSFSRDTEKAHRLDLNRTRVEGELKALQDRIWNT